MSDNLKIRRPQDPTQVNIHEEWEVQYRMKTWNVTRDQLVHAEKTVGTKTVDVARFLGKRP